MLIKRRSVIQGLAGMACTTMFMRSIAAEAASANGIILVVVGLNGGNDGLNTVIPLQQYTTYAALRTPPLGGGTLAYSEPSLQATAFAGNKFAFAPTMGPMLQLYNTGKLAVLTGIGLPAAEAAPLSHSNAWSDWSTGQINVNMADLPSGWLGAALGQTGGSLGPTLSTAGGQEIITTNGQLGLVVGSPSSFSLSIPWNVNGFQLGDAFQRVLDLPPTSAAAANDRTTTNATLNAAGAMQNFSQLASDYPSVNTGLDYQLRSIAQMILGGAGIRGYFAVDGGYDTHSNQNGGGNPHSALVGNMSNSLYQFYTYLKAKGVSGNVVIATISDFGRTPHANLSIGTDHGAASVAFVLGDRVKGGVYGSYPSLSKFDVNGNLAVNVDFRNMLSDLINASGGNPTTVLGQTFPRLGFI